MVNIRLIREIPGSIRWTAGVVALQWCGLVSTIIAVAAISKEFDSLYQGAMGMPGIVLLVVAVFTAVLVRALCTLAASCLSHRFARRAKRTLRSMLYEKLLRLGPAYREHAQTAQVVQIAVEGIDQLEVYFGSYLPQLVYAVVAPLTLFAVLAPVDIVSAVVLLVCVPLIPVSIVAIQRWAKRLLARYWNRYTELGDLFLENVQGLTTLKVYQADGRKHREMNEKAEEFRRITMRVLTMQLNSIAVMDLVAFGGAAAGIALALARFQIGAVSLAGMLLIILLGADFFIPLRQLGSFFHIAMNGMAASDGLFKILDAPEPRTKELTVPAAKDGVPAVGLRNVAFSYDGSRPALSGVSFEIPQGSLVALVGTSGCGKSTIASLLAGRMAGYEGSVAIAGEELRDLSPLALANHVTLVNHQAYLFAGSVRENLLMACPEASDEKLWEVLERTRLDAFLRAEDGLDTFLAERASNLSGGQRQRLALARALLHDSAVYVFDEATSNVDVESEEAIYEAMLSLRGRKTIVVISHRLAPIAAADRIVVLRDGAIAQQGTHEELMARGGAYAEMVLAQRELENVGVAA